LISPLLSFFSDTVAGTFKNEDLKKLVQPRSLAAAAIFLVLNAILIYPTPALRRLPAIIEIENLPALWQVVLGVLLLLILSYLLNSLEGTFLALTNGSALRDSPIVGQSLLLFQQLAFQELKSVVENSPLATEQFAQQSPKEKARVAVAANRLAYEYPREKAELAPTRLGNVLLCTSSYTLYQYGIHFETMWPYMQSLIDTKPDEKLKSQIQESWAELTFLCTLVVLLTTVAIELFMLRMLALRGGLAPLIWSISLLVVAYTAYWGAIHKARSWQRSIRLAFDLYIDDLATKLGLYAIEPTTENAIKERKRRWEEVTNWLSRGALEKIGNWQVPVQNPVWYKAPTHGTSLLRIHAPLVRVTPYREIRGVERVGRTQYAVGTIINYLFTFTNEQQDEHAKTATGVFFLITDPAVPSLPDRVNGKLQDSRGGKSIVGVPAQTEDSTLSWLLDDIPPWHTCTLSYWLITEGLRVEVSPHTFEIVTCEKSTATNNEDPLYTLHLRYSGLPLLPRPATITLTMTNVGEVIVPESAHWRYWGMDEQTPVPLKKNGTFEIPGNKSNLDIQFNFNISKR
jgi:hypothetical protein